MAAHNFPVVHPRWLMRAHRMGILMHMRTTLDIDDDLLREAARLTRIQEATTLVNCGLERPCY